MKSFLFVALVLAIGNQVIASPLSKEAIYRERALRLEVNINEYFDTLVAKLKELIVKENLDPMALPNLERTFSFKDLLGIRWHGEIGLEQGSLKDLGHLQRKGNATINYDHQLLQIKTEIGFSDLAMDYGFVAQIMNIGPKGDIHAKIYNLLIVLDVIADLETYDIYLQKLTIEDAGKIDVDVDSLGLLDIITNAIVELVTTVFHDTIVNIIDAKVREVVEKVLADFDLGSILGGGGNSTAIRHF